MARYLLDTTALIDFSKNRQPATSRIQQMIHDGDALAICAINVAEFYSGIPATAYATWTRFFGSLGYWNIGLDAAMQAGRFRYQFARKGISLSTPDTLVAAVALEKGAVIATNNAKDYPMAGVQLLSLRV